MFPIYFYLFGLILTRSCHLFHSFSLFCFCSIILPLFHPCLYNVLLLIFHLCCLTHLYWSSSSTSISLLRSNVLILFNMFLLMSFYVILSQFLSFIRSSSTIRVCFHAFIRPFSSFQSKSRLLFRWTWSIEDGVSLRAGLFWWEKNRSLFQFWKKNQLFFWTWVRWNEW